MIKIFKKSLLPFHVRQHVKRRRVLPRKNTLCNDQKLVIRARYIGQMLHTNNVGTQMTNEQQKQLPKILYTYQMTYNQAKIMHVLPYEYNIPITTKFKSNLFKCQLMPLLYLSELEKHVVLRS